MMEELHIDKSDPFPIHVQLVEQLKYHIETGTWEAGAQLPTVRELARGLRINYNTARSAYQELERQGYVRTEQGRGTFVAPNPPRLPEDAQEMLLDLIDGALIKARALGISEEEFVRVVSARARLLASTTADVRLLFIECNPTDLDYYSDTIEAGTGIRPESLLVRDLERHEPAFFEQFDLITTTMFHVTEVKAILGQALTVIGLMIEPSYLDALAEISRLPGGARVGLVCVNQEGAKLKECALLGSGVTHLEYLTAGITQPSELEKLLEWADYVYVSRAGLHQYRGSWPEGKPIREYVDDIDSAALHLLRRHIARIRAERASA